jgi:hypothetical protein
MKWLSTVIATGILSIVAMPAIAGSVPDANVITTFCTTACSYLDSLTSDPSLSASAGTYHVPPNPDTNTGSGFVTLNYYYAVVGPAGNAGTYVPVTITGSVTVLSGGVDGESEASINYANGGVNTKNYGPGVLTTYGYSYATPMGDTVDLNTTYDVISSTSSDPTALLITLFVDVNAGTGGQAQGTSSASAGADPIISLSPALLAAGYSLEFSPNLSTTPLPSTWLMLLSGFVGLGFFAYRGTKKGSAAIAAT